MGCRISVLCMCLFKAEALVLRVPRAPYDPVFMIQGPYLVKVRLWRFREGSKTASQEALKAGNHPPSRTRLEKACFEG